MMEESVKNGSLRKKSSLRRQKTYEMLTAYSFITPFFVLMAIFTLFVFYKGALLSMTSARGISAGKFIGTQNYVNALKNPDFWNAVKVTFLYTLGSLVTQIPAAFVLAYILNGIPKRFQAVLRASFYVPVLISTVVIALLFRMLFNRDQGAINWLMGLVGLPNQLDWVKDSSLTLPLMWIVSFWQWTGYHMVFFLAYLQTIDQSLYEAARIDGASPMKILWKVVLPLMRPAVTFVMLTSAIGGLMTFELVFLLFPDATYGPGGSARTIVAYIFDQAFSRKFQLGYASAVAWLAFFIILAVSLLQLRILGLGKSDE